ncbi:uncharacterized protein F4822DRAFT_247412 [Hypoxylon trugodes]|uniref:uncharacterized protein n=1 Tax=Hypoxylon trugodes TaxID=326681 RepID=UPI0021941704|nr:uncharacterized protein F4822DRAFT_247412 [Hypoxylon trugodes]KAI1388455.1 hypothetical protein F4822DRAFT_247412 [Hypoxylon trugodes]
MADNPNLSAILAALNAVQQNGASTTPTQGQNPYAVPNYQQPLPGAPPGVAGVYSAPQSMPPSMNNQALPPYNTSGYPAPAQTSAVGGYDLSAIRPVNSGTVNIGDAIAQAKNYATEKGLTPYERPPADAYQHDARTMSARHYRSRSRSPPARRDAFRDNVNPYRDERRNDRGGAHVRDYGRDRDRSGSPEDSEIINIDAGLVGLIIGRQGENLRRVESETLCRVQFMSASGEPAVVRQCKITGPRARRAEAKAAINRIIEDSGMGAIARAGLDKQQPNRRDPAHAPNPSALREGEECMQIMVPDRTVGLIIGRGGETIRDLQDRSGCHINIVGEDQSVDGLRPVNLIGNAAASTQAKELILEIVASDSRNNNNNNDNNNNRPRPQRTEHVRDNTGSNPDKINDAIYVPSEAVGMIIGKGGETIREMQNTTGCKINVSGSSGPNEVQREIGLVGSRDAISKAKRAIEDKVDAVRQKNSGGNQSRPPRNQHQRRDWDNPNYAQPASQAAEPPAAGNSSDPYAMYGGYDRYVALWYSLYAQQNSANPPQGEAPQPPGA